MNKVLLFGASGNLGKEVALELKRQGYDLTVVVRNKGKAESLAAITTNYHVVNIADKAALENCCLGFDIIVSTLGKSVSLNDKSTTSFNDIDLEANSAILEDAKKNGVKKFVYVSALHSENYLHLEYFRVHHEFSERLKRSGIDYSIIKPPAIFCAFVDVIAMAKQGKLMNIGKGDKRTNPIYEGDLAQVCVRAIRESNKVIEAGGKHTYTRKQINEIIMEAVKPGKKLRSIPVRFMNAGLPFIKLLNKNAYDKLAFYSAVMQHDTIAPPVGEMRFEEYVKLKV